jgi:PAS domain S-box-containing protein
MSASFNRWFVRYGFRAGLGTLILVGFLYYAQKQNLQSSFAWVLHTANIEGQLMRLSQAIQLQDQNGKIQHQIKTLQASVKDNPLQEARLKSISTLFENRTKYQFESSMSLEFRRLQMAKLDEQVLVLISEMLNEETRLMDERESHSRTSIELIDIPIAFGGLLACFLIYMANRIARKDLQDLLEKDRELQKQTYEISRSRDALEMQTKILNLTLESMADGLIVFDEGRNPVQINRAARELLGFGPGGKTLTNESLYNVKRRDPATNRYLSEDELPSARAFRGEIIKDMELIIESEGLPERVMSFSSSPIQDDENKIFRAVTVFRDITKRHRLEMELINAEKAALETVQMKSQFLANMSHEIRTPMNGIIGMTEILGGTKLDSKQRSYLELIFQSAQSLMTIINDILDFSKIEAGKLDIEQSDFNFSYSIDRTVQLMAHRAHEKSLVLLTHISPQIPEKLNGDAGRIGQVLINLIGNAIKFTDHGKVIVRAELIEQMAQKAKIRFEVEDTGIGLDSSNIEKLFQPFSQADNSTSKKFGGTGLGLSICKQLVELMGGKLGVQSELGHGSKFWFELMLNTAIEPASLESYKKTFPPENEILIFDADPDSAQILTDYIASWKLRARHLKVVSDLEKLVSKAEDLTEYDLFLVSTYPEQQEVEKLLHALQKRVDRPRVTVILDSESLELQARYRNMGVSNFLIRPIEQSGLYNHLMRLLSENGNLEQFQTAASELPEQPLKPAKIGRILIAEDNSVNQLIAQAFLKELGYPFHTVANGKEVLEALEQSEFDLILMDCQMPEMDGFEATREIRKNLSSTLPIVALTANAMKGDEEKCRQAGMNGYLSKPFRKDQLQAILQKHLIANDLSGFDPNRLEMLKEYKDENGVDLRISLIETYLRLTPGTLNEMLNCYQSDPKHFQQIAHTLKSSSAAVGGTRLAEMLEHLETQETTVSQRKEMAMSIQTEFQKLKDHLLRYTKGLK